jgi:REP element-mobilizing transposase RayT
LGSIFKINPIWSTATSGGKMANEPLLFGQYYHIYNRGNNRENLFVEKRNYPYFLQLYAKYIQPVALTYAYSLLPNHYHFLIRTFTEEEQEAYHQAQIGSISEIDPIFKLREPSRAFNNLGIAYARALNKATGRTGALFDSPFGRKIVDNDRYFITLIAYIHRNPQKHGFVTDFRDWPWTSYGTVHSTKPTKIQRDELLAWYGNLANFEDAHQFETDESFIEPLIIDDWF